MKIVNYSSVIKMDESQKQGRQNESIMIPDMHQSKQVKQNRIVLREGHLADSASRAHSS